MKTYMNLNLVYSKLRLLFKMPVLVGIILIYLCIGFAQYYFVKHQLYKNIEVELKEATNQISNELVDNDGWQIESFRRSIVSFPNWHIIDTSGNIIDIEGFLPNIIGNIEPLDDLFFQHPQNVLPEFKERSKLFAVRLDSGYIVLCIHQPSNLKDEDTLLYSNAILFGTNLHQALSIRANDIDNSIDVAIVSSNHHLLRTWGGVPLKSPHLSSEYLIPHFQTLETPEGTEYLFFKSIFAKNHNTPIGVIIVYKNISDTVAALQNQLLFNIGFVFIAIIFTLLIFAAKGLLKSNPPFYTIEQAIVKGEDEHIEFKETFNWDVRLHQPSLLMRSEVIEAVAGFSNASGGQVFIGISDNASVIGIEHDLSLSNGSRDKYEQLIANSISEYLDRAILATCLISFLEFSGKIVCVISIPKSKRPVYLRTPNRSKFVIRTQNATRSLEINEAVAYIRDHW